MVGFHIRRQDYKVISQVSTMPLTPKASKEGSFFRWQNHSKKKKELKIEMGKMNFFLQIIGDNEY